MRKKKGVAGYLAADAAPDEALDVVHDGGAAVLGGDRRLDPAHDGGRGILEGPPGVGGDRGRVRVGRRRRMVGLLHEHHGALVDVDHGRRSSLAGSPEAPATATPRP